MNYIEGMWGGGGGILVVGGGLTEILLCFYEILTCKQLKSSKFKKPVYFCNVFRDLYKIQIY